MGIEVKPIGPTAEQFSAVFERIKTSYITLFHKIEAEIRARSKLAEIRAAHVRDGVEGKNQLERDANLEGLIRDERRDLEIAESEIRDARLAHKIHTLELDSLRYQLRAVEVALLLEDSAK